MKKFSSKKRILLVMAICAAMMLPAVASAELVAAGAATKVFPGDTTLELVLAPYMHTSIPYEVVNGDSGENTISSAKVCLLDTNGEEFLVLLSPDQFNHDFGGTSGIIARSDVDAAGYTVGESLQFSVKVRGKKTNFITLILGEEGGGPFFTSPPPPVTGGGFFN